ncbi:MAG: polysaccharide lyase 6 family protein [Chitinophagales bacterium]
MNLNTNQLSSTYFILLLCILSSMSCSNSTAQTTGLVHNLEEFKKTVESAKAGDKIILANGVWKDVELVFVGEGTEKAPITLTVEEKGKVTLEGQSNLRMAGEYLVIEGLVFKNGFTPTNEVISLRRNKEYLCNNCRVTECVIDNYSNPERFESDYWVGIYGKNNRFDHNYLTGKRNHGVTLAVRLTTEESQENHHQIDHNYFGYHPILGSNGGETLRIGTSHHSLTNSNTLVENNYFDRCNGEHEIISNKSCQNIYRGNTFYECQGTLTMRHGNETLVESNYFFGNGKANTGGIRIINEKQKVVNNYCEGLTGYRFRGALVIMNGVPNSPLNRYFQVKDSEASNNTFINCDYIQLCAGSDEERSATPENTVVSNNLFYNEKKDDLFTVYDDISGIKFEGNILSENIQAIAKKGFENKKIILERNKEGILMPKGDTAKGAGITEVKDHASPENTGVTWYPLIDEEVRFGTGKVIAVKAGMNTLFDAAKTAQKGDILELEAGEYMLTKAIDLYYPITVRAAKGAKEKPFLQFQKTSLFNIENGGSLTLQNVVVDGMESPDSPGNAVIRTSRYSMNHNYKLFVEDCKFQNLDINHSFEVLKVFQNTFADSILLRNSVFDNISGSVLSLDKETDDIGIYNVENVVIENCEFNDIEGVAVNLHRGGGDESTFGPILEINHSTFNKVGYGKRNKTEAAISLHGVQFINIENSSFNDSESLKMHLSVGEPVVNISHSNFSNSKGIISNDDAYKLVEVTEKETAVDLKGNDGKAIGIFR